MRRRHCTAGLFSRATHGTVSATAQCSGLSLTLAGDDDDYGRFVMQYVAATREIRDVNGHYF